MNDYTPTLESAFVEIREILIRNGDTFAGKSTFLDALLVFAGLFSAVLATFLIEVHKGLQEDLLDGILQELQSRGTPRDLPTPPSLWINGMWFASLSVSLASALFVLVAKGMGSRVLDRTEARALAEAHSVRKYNDILARPPHTPLNLTKADLSFVPTFEFLVRSATAAISISLLLFYPGLVALVYSTNKGIGVGVATVAAATTISALVCLVYYSRMWAGSHVVRVAHS